MVLVPASNYLAPTGSLSACTCTAFVGVGGVGFCCAWEADVWLAMDLNGDTVFHHPSWDRVVTWAMKHGGEFDIVLAPAYGDRPFTEGLSNPFTAPASKTGGLVRPAL